MFIITWNSCYYAILVRHRVGSWEPSWWGWYNFLAHQWWVLFTYCFYHSVLIWFIAVLSELHLVIKPPGLLRSLSPQPPSSVTLGSACHCRSSRCGTELPKSCSSPATPPLWIYGVLAAYLQKCFVESKKYILFHSAFFEKRLWIFVNLNGSMVFLSLGVMMARSICRRLPLASPSWKFVFSVLCLQCCFIWL